MPTVADIGERELLQRLCRLQNEHQQLNEHIVVGPGDDAAVVQTRACALVQTCDAMVEGVHFRFEWSPLKDIGWKAVAAAVSDVAAMGGLPLTGLVTLGLPAELPLLSIDELYEGMLECAGVHQLVIIGGDVVRSERLFLSVAVTGRLVGAQPFCLQQAVPGELIYVTGPLGIAELGVRLLTAEKQLGPRGALCLAAHRHPWARTDLVVQLSQAGVRCATDTSDGLVADLTKICTAAGVGAIVDLEQLPVHPTTLDVARALQLDVREIAATGGEDFELLFTLPQNRPAPADCRCIGTMTEGPGVAFVRHGISVDLTQQGFDHFRTS